MINRKKNHGLTLIEMLISIAISTVMISIAIGQLISSRTLYSLQETDTRIGENARYALELLTENIQIAGHKNDHGIISDVRYITGQFYSVACGDYDICTDDGEGTNSDHFAVYLDPSDDITCSGVTLSATTVSTTPPSDAIIANVFFIAEDNGINSLKCASYEHLGGVNPNQLIPGSEATLIQGVDNMQVLYGLSDEDNIFQYVSAETINDKSIEQSKADWAKIASVQISLLVGSGYDDGADAPNSRDYSLPGAPTITYTDKNRRKVFTTRMAIRNEL